MSAPQISRDLEAPLQGSADDVDRLIEWPELLGLEDLLLDNGQLPSHLADRPYPQELQVFPDDVSAELLQIISQPSETDQPTKLPAVPDVNDAVRPESSVYSRGTSATNDHSSLPLRSQAPAVRAYASDTLSERCLSPESTASKFAFYRPGAKPTKETKNLKLRLLERNSFRECASCFVELLDKNLVPLACVHKYCLGCFSDMIVTAMKNESKFPPRCCLEDIPTKLILHNTDSVLKEEYKLKLQEYAIPRINRWYCPSPNCGKWIPPKRIKLGALSQKCPHCKLSICSACRGVVHEGQERCPQGLHAERTESVVSNGWRRCYKCHAMVDLTASAGYVICHCGAEFCFCGARGGSCGCLQSTNNHVAYIKRDPDTFRRDRTQLAATSAESEHGGRQEIEERLLKDNAHSLPENDGQRWQDEEHRRVQHDKDIKRLVSIASQIQKLQGELAKINRIQQTMIISRHQNSAERIQVTAASKQANFNQMRVKLEKAYEANFKLRKSALETGQSTKTLELLARQEEDEDDNFVQMQRHLKGKPNREEREKTILDKLNAAHKREQELLEKAHKDQLNEMEYHGNLESSALQSGIMKQLGDLQRETNYTLYELSSTVISDRRWFKIVIEKRYGLLEEHRMFLMRGSEAAHGATTSSSRYSSANNSNISATTRSGASGRETPQSPLSPPPVPMEFAYKRPGSDSLKTSLGVTSRSRSRSASNRMLSHVADEAQLVLR